MKDLGIARIRGRIGACIFAGCVFMGGVGAFLPSAGAEVPVTDTDGGIVEQDCVNDAPQLRVDSSDLPGRAGCFGLIHDSGWVALRITGAFGVVNHLTQPVAVSFKLPSGAVYWTTVVGPGEVRAIDINRAQSTVVELMVAPVASSTGPSSAVLAPPGDGEGPRVVSLRSASSSTRPLMLRVSWSGIGVSELNRNSPFTDRLDAAFIVRRGIADPECVSLETAAYPGAFLQASSVDGRGGVELSIVPDPAAATWCVSPVESPPTAVRLLSGTDQTFALAIERTGDVTVAASYSDESLWFVDRALAYPSE